MITPLELFLLGGFALIAAFLIFRFFRKEFLLPTEEPLFLPIKTIFFGFAIYLGCSFVFVPIFQRFFMTKIVPFPEIARIVWLSFGLSAATVIGLFSYLFTVPAFPSLWKKKGMYPWWCDLRFGVVACLITFPIMLFWNELLNFLTYSLFHIHALPDQIAVTFVKMSLEYPFYFSILLINIVVFAPLIEETLFRGLLQTSLKSYFGRKVAIPLTAVCFSLFHFSRQQGIANLPILLSLFVLALLLGWTYEKRGSLLAPMTLHSCFNLISIMNLYGFY